MNARREDPEVAALRTVLAQLAAEFGGTLSQETIERSVNEMAERFRGSQISTFVPLFVERLAREQLRSLGRTQSHASQATRWAA